MFTKHNFYTVFFLTVALTFSISAQQFTLEATIDYSINKNIIFDIDGDGVCEYFVFTDGTYNVYDGSTHQIKYSLDGYINFNDVVRAQNPYIQFPNIDFNSDGIKEIIMQNAEEGTAVFVFDLNNNRKLFEFDPPEESASFETLIDIDGDGELELIIQGYTDNWPEQGIYKTYIFSTGVSLTNLEKTTNSVIPNYKLEQNYPNPFNPNTTIDYKISKPSNVTINIYNVNGQLIKELINEERNSGNYSLSWNGKDTKGNKVASGTYFYQIQTGDFMQAKKMLMLK